MSVSVVNETLPQNHFVLFGLPEDFSIDMQQLRSAYQSLLLKFHPDRFSSNTEAEQTQALRQTDRINQAYATLCSLPRRAAYLLRIKGFSVDEQANLLDDPDFLLEQLSLRETLEQVAEKIQPESMVNSLLERAAFLQKKEVDAFVAFFHQLLVKQAGVDEQVVLQKATHSILKLRFIEKLFEEIDALQHSLLD